LLELCGFDHDDEGRGCEDQVVAGPGRHRLVMFKESAFVRVVSVGSTFSATFGVGL